MTDMPPNITIDATAYASTIQSPFAMVTISQDEKVICIDWAEVEKQAQGSDPFLRPLAKALISARDKTYQSVR